MFQRLQHSPCEAARNEQTSVFSSLLGRGLIIDDYFLKTAREGQSADIFKASLDHGLDINSRLFSGTTLLWE